MEGDQLINEGLETGQVSFGDADWIDYDVTFEPFPARMTAKASNDATLDSPQCPLRPNGRSFRLL
jgi:hypothetical protein